MRVTGTGDHRRKREAQRDSARPACRTGPASLDIEKRLRVGMDMNELVEYRPRHLTDIRRLARALLEGDPAPAGTTAERKAWAEVEEQG